MTQMLRTIDSTKRITSFAQNGDKKVIIGRRNGIGRIPTYIRQQIQKLDLKKQPHLETAYESFIIPDFSYLENFFQWKFQTRLLYRASQQNFSVKTFHQMCDGIPNTLVLCKTQACNIIGGFTPLSWDNDYEESQSYFKTDSTDETFIFSVTSQEKYRIKKSFRNKAICCFQKFGPTFGGGYDLCIGDNADFDATTFSYFPSNFQSPDLNETKQNINYEFTGSIKKNFKLREWEVFQIKFMNKQPLKRLIVDLNFVNVEQLRLAKKKKTEKFGKLGKFLKKLFQINE